MNKHYFIPATDVLAMGADRLMQDVTISYGEGGTEAQDDMDDGD